VRRASAIAMINGRLWNVPDAENFVGKALNVEVLVQKSRAW
jgi:hypothetical protein